MEMGESWNENEYENVFLMKLQKAQARLSVLDREFELNLTLFRRKVSSTMSTV